MSMADGHTAAEALSNLAKMFPESTWRKVNKYPSPSPGTCYLTNWNVSCGSEWSPAYPNINLKHGYLKLKWHSICGILFTKK